MGGSRSIAAMEIVCLDPTAAQVRIQRNKINSCQSTSAETGNGIIVYRPETFQSSYEVNVR